MATRKFNVLDEADRILDLGFANTMNAIIENLPEQRQTLLFSATQTKSVRDLARLSLHDPEYIAVHENSKYSTPQKLVQNYILVNLQDKINFLFSFIKNHLKSKSIVFLSSCKQVKFMHEVFRKLRPGAPLLALYGKQKQLKRVAIYNRFCNTQHAVLFATDIASRGLDFPAVGWVLQFDCPENVNTYIHRVGRTARYEKGGQALILLLPSEETMIKQMQERKIPIHEIKVNPKKIRSIQGKLQAFCAQDQDIKHWAQKSIVSYARSVHLQSNKSVFDVTKLPLDEFATSCGLLAPPKIRFMKKLEKKIGPSTENNLHISEEQGRLGIELLADRLAQSDSDNKVSDEENECTQDKSRSKKKYHHASDKIGKKVESIKFEEESEMESDDDVLVKKTSNFIHETLDDLDIQSEKANLRKKKIVTKASLAKKVIRKNIKVNTKIVFDEEGEETREVGTNIKTELSEVHSLDVTANTGGINVDEAKIRMKKQDRLDRETERKRIKQKHRELKKKERKERKAPAMGTSIALLELPNDEDGGELDKDGDTGKNTAEELSVEPPRKRKRKHYSKVSVLSEEPVLHAGLAEDEELALHLLGVN